MKYYLGVDCGLSGAFAFYDPLTDELEIFDMPTHTLKVGKKMKRQVDVYGLARIVDVKARDVKKALIEGVSAMPGQGVSSCFSFGFVAGCCHMVIASNFIPMNVIAASAWKRVMNVTKDKGTAFRAASRLLPRHSDKWNLKKHDGRVEATLLAYLAAQTDKKVISLEGIL